jgi:hypothetical protein
MQVRGSKDVLFLYSGARAKRNASQACLKGADTADVLLKTLVENYRELWAQWRAANEATKGSRITMTSEES